MKRFLNSLDIYATLDSISKQYSESNEGFGTSSLVEIPSLLEQLEEQMAQNERILRKYVILLNNSDDFEFGYSRNRIDHSESSIIIL